MSESPARERFKSDRKCNNLFTQACRQARSTCCHRLYRSMKACSSRQPSRHRNDLPRSILFTSFAAALSLFFTYLSPTDIRRAQLHCTKALPFILSLARPPSDRIAPRSSFPHFRSALLPPPFTADANISQQTEAQKIIINKRTYKSYE